MTSTAPAEPSPGRAGLPVATGRNRRFVLTRETMTGTVRYVCRSRTASAAQAGAA
ncbi:hypothetical protein [Streptomyces sp. NPDC056492]|uniref:hypothetical protein n=1 Tax=unclassified Streptomyces TaxID=2593676 RepID=UPI00367C77D2